jgi:poly(hydroxyalkanoate) granule-associated protein
MRAETGRGLDVLKQDLKTAGRDVWLAGLGAVAVVEEQSRRMFDTLKAHGERFEPRPRKTVEDALNGASRRLKAMTPDIEGRVRDMAASFLHRMGVPTQGDIETLRASVERLSASVDAASRRMKGAQR